MDVGFANGEEGRLRESDVPKANEFGPVVNVGNTNEGCHKVAWLKAAKNGAKFQGQTAKEQEIALKSSIKPAIVKPTKYCEYHGSDDWPCWSCAVDDMDMDLDDFVDALNASKNTDKRSAPVQCAKGNANAVSKSQTK